MSKQNIKSEHTDEFLLNELKRYYNEFGEVPTRRKLDKNKDYPGASIYRTKFGSLKEALHLLGFKSLNENINIIHNNVKNDYKNGMSLDDLVIKYNLKKNNIILILNKSGIKIKANIWTNEEFEFLKENYLNMTDSEIATVLGSKTEKQIKTKREHEKLRRVFKYSNDFLISEFWRFYKENDRYPLGKEMKKKNGYPDIGVYQRNFGTWNDFLKIVNVLGEDEWYLCDEQVLIDYYPSNNIKKIKELLMIKRSESAIRHKANKIGLKVLNSNGTYCNKDYEGIKKDYINGMELNEIANKYGYSDSANICNIINKLGINKRNDRWTKTQIEILKEKYPYEEWYILIELLKPFTKDEICQKASKLNIQRENYYWTDEEINLLKDNYNNLSPQKLLILFPNRTYESLTTKAYKSGISESNKWDEQEINILKEKYACIDNKDLIKLFPGRKITQLINMAMKLNIRKDYSSDYFVQKNEKNKQDALIALKNFAQELGRTPLGQEVTDNKDMPGLVTYIRYFGGYREACIKASLEPNSNSIYNKKIYFSNNNDICLSKAELIITNYMIDINTNYIKEVLYRDLIDDNRCGLKRMDWLVNDGIIIEFFGMPDKDFYKIKMEEKIKICNDNEIILIDLYPKDLRYNLQGVKEKLRSIELLVA